MKGALFLLSLPLLIAGPSGAATSPSEGPRAVAPSTSAASVVPSTTAASASSATARPAADAGVEVDTFAFATEVSSMTPVAPSDAFDADVRSVYFWNRLVVKKPPVRVRHVWYHGAEKVADYPLTLRYSRTRIWTSKRVSPGQWRVDVADEQGEPILSASFVVRPKGSTPPQKLGE